MEPDEFDNFIEEVDKLAEKYGFEITFGCYDEEGLRLRLEQKNDT